MFITICRAAVGAGLRPVDSLPAFTGGGEESRFTNFGTAPNGDNQDSDLRFFGQTHSRKQSPDKRNYSTSTGKPSNCMIFKALVVGQGPGRIL